VSGEKIASPVGGRIVEVHFAEGDRVKAGQVLLRLDTARIDHEIAKLEGSISEEELHRLERLRRTIEDQESAALERNRREREEAGSGTARVRLENARERETRLRDLVAEGLEPAERLREAEGALRESEAEARTAEARLRRVAGEAEVLRQEFAARRAEVELRIESKRAAIAAAREAIEVLRLERAQCEIRAHVSGVVTQGHWRVGEHLDAGKTAVAIAQELGFRVDVYLPASEVSQVREGMKARVRLDGVERGVVEGTVYYVSPDSAFLEGAMVYVVRVRLERTDLPVKFGMAAGVEIVTGRKRVSEFLLGRP
jgi:HlyD family secretion protein